MSVTQLMINAGHTREYAPWTDTIGTNTAFTTGTVTDVTTNPEHKSFANGAYIDFSGGSATAAMRVQFRFRRDSGYASFEGIYSREADQAGQAGSIWTYGGNFVVYDTVWRYSQYPLSYNTWYWVDVSHSGTSMTLRIYNGGTESAVGTQLYANTYTLGTATGDYSNVRLMAGWSNSSWAGNGDLGAVRYNVGATNTNWTSSFFPYKT